MWRYDNKPRPRRTVRRRRFLLPPPGGPVSQHVCHLLMKGLYVHDQTGWLMRPGSKVSLLRLRRGYSALKERSKGHGKVTNGPQPVVGVTRLTRQRRIPIPGGSHPPSKRTNGNRRCRSGDFSRRRGDRRHSHSAEWPKRAVITPRAPGSPYASQPTSPFTGMPGGADAPVLAVKIDNVRPARPHTGLSKADIVYVEPVEGGLSPPSPRILAVAVPGRKSPRPKKYDSDARLRRGV
ncbi:MAG TPA: DUF3048 domain-containing protein [Streptosporangiaceae bacterium]